jgi:cell filamentation protein
VPGYTLSDGVTLKNKVGANDPDKLDRLEAAYVLARYSEIDAGFGPKGQFDAEHLKAIHQYLFQDVYEWAGHTRDERVTLSDGTVATEPMLSKAEGQPFLIGPAIPAALDDIGAKLRDANYLRGLPREEFAERAANVMIELNTVHPFREGNGRTQRAFMEKLAQTAGHDLDFMFVSKERMIQASIAAHELDDPSMMRRMFEEISDPARAALLRESVEALEKSKFKWNEHYVATLAPGHTVDLVLAGVRGDQFMARTQTEILFGRTADLPEPRPERGETFTVTAAPYARQEESIEHNPQGAGEKASADDLLQQDLRAAEKETKSDDAPGKPTDRGKGRGR